MITETIINFFTFIAQGIINMITEVIPTVDLAVNMAYFTGKIITICTQARNFLYFLLGDFMTVLILPTIVLLVYKYTAYPILVFIRSIFVNGNN